VDIVNLMLHTLLELSLGLFFFFICRILAYSRVVCLC